LANIAGLDKGWIFMESYKVRISSSIANFKDKILKRYGWQEYNWLRDIYKRVTFFGLYHFLDWSRFIIHRGQKHVFWCGGDILNLQKAGNVWQKLIAKQKADHVVENMVEKLELENMGICARVQPIILDDPRQFNICYRQSDKPKVFVCCHEGYEEQYGVNMLEGIAAVVPDVEINIYGVTGESHDNVKYHGRVSNERFNEEIRKYQAGLRLNDFDGMGEVTYKSLLLGQWPISRISYPYVTFVKDTTDLINALNDLKNKKEPNYVGEVYWRNEAKKPLI